MSKLKADEAVLGLAASVTARACELISDGWIKGRMSSGEGGVQEFCIHGALNLAIDEVFGENRRARNVAAQNVEDVAVAFICDEAFGKMHTHSGGIPAASFNDASDRKHEEVLGVLGRAATRLWDLTVEQETVGEGWTPSQWAEVDTESEQAKQYLHASLN